MCVCMCECVCLCECIKQRNERQEEKIYMRKTFRPQTKFNDKTPQTD